MDLTASTAHVDPDRRPGRRHAIALRLATLWRRPRERALALSLALAAAGTVAFARVTEDYLTKDPLARWDVSFARWLAGHRSAAGIDAFQTVTDLGSPAVSAVVAAIVCVLLFRRRRLAEAALLPLALAGAEVLNLALKAAFHRERPEVAFVHLDTYSYPSGHAMIAAAAYGAFAYLAWSRLRGLRTRLVATGAMVAVVALISASRIYLGVHYLSDVLGGIAGGAAWLGVAIALHILFGDRFAARFAGSRLDRLARVLTRS